MGVVVPELAVVPGELPEPSAEMILLRVFAEAYVATNSRRKGEKFLRFVAAKLADEENFAAVFPIQPTPTWGAARRAQRQAVGQYRAWLPALLSRVDVD